MSSTKAKELTKVKIYLLSDFKELTLCGVVRYYMLCKGVIIKNEYMENLATRMDRAEVYSLYKALQFINNTCNIEVVTRYPSLFKEEYYSESLDKDLLHNIKVINSNMKHNITFSSLTDKHIEMLTDLEIKYRKFDENWRDSREIEKGIKRQSPSKVKAKVYYDSNISDIQNRNSMYSDLDDKPGQRAWVEGSGGY